MNIEPHTLTPAELLRFHPDSPLAEPMQQLLDQLEQAGKALTAARTLQGVADSADETRFRDIEEWRDALGKASAAFNEADDGELGS